jgi:hypothetical protein
MPETKPYLRSAGHGRHSEALARSCMQRGVGERCREVEVVYL